MSRCICYLVIATAPLLAASFAQNAPELFERKGRLVPNKETAIRIAEAIPFQTYGEKNIREQRPCQVSLKDGKWTIDGAPRRRVLSAGVSISLFFSAMLVSSRLATTSDSPSFRMQ
jgi:NTF2 fold immunity protein